MPHKVLVRDEGAWGGPHFQECGHWCQGLGASLGFGTLAPRGENFKEEKWLVEAQQ